ncbi:pyridoxamine 5'-phosphate oxidase family protein [Shewanella sp.]|uniref:pyridoxamine 5'-phosphate oxidase family protein n=1 Tax=Shewanella sp. TaxID=50422 RepID=UPI003F3D24C9
MIDMIDKTQRLQDRISPEIQQFRDSRLCLQLASIDTEGFAHASYAPFVYQDLCYYILISDLANHGQNLKQNNKVGIILLDDEASAKDVFARRRLSYTALAELVERDTDTWQAVTDALYHRAGETSKTLSGLQDFNLYRLRPLRGRYVKGFGKAYEIDADELPKVTALDESNIKGHIAV